MSIFTISFASFHFLPACVFLSHTHTHTRIAQPLGRSGAAITNTNAQRARSSACQRVSLPAFDRRRHVPFPFAPAALTPNQSVRVTHTGATESSCFRRRRRRMSSHSHRVTGNRRVTGSRRIIELLESHHHTVQTKRLFNARRRRPVCRSAV